MTASPLPCRDCTSTTISLTMVRISLSRRPLRDCEIEELCCSSRNLLCRLVTGGSDRRWSFGQTNIIGACICSSPRLNGKIFSMLETKAAHGKLNVETYLSLLSAITASWTIRLAQAEVKVCIFIGTSRGATLELKRCLMEYSFILHVR